MRRCSRVLLLGMLLPVASWGQEVNVYSTSMLQFWNWKQEIPEYQTSSFAPLTEFLGVDATKLGTDGLSMHLDGWAMRDLADPSFDREKKSAGYLNYGYLKYRFSQANAEIKAGRFIINPGMTLEQVDGVSARTDLRGGFTVSVFGGRPVLFRTSTTAAQKEYDYQHDFIFGTRVSSRLSRFGEIGLSYLQDGTSQPRNTSSPAAVDYTRRQAGIDLRLAPIRSVDITGRSFFDVAGRPGSSINGETPSRTAEHDYTVSVKATPKLTFSGGYTERNFQAYFAGTNLPSLFNQIERDSHRAYEGKVIWGAASDIQVVADFRQTHRDTFGDARRFGGEVRWNASALKLKSGLGYHQVSADDVQMAGAQVPSYSLSHGELRAWVMYETGMLFTSLDGVYQKFTDQANPNLNGRDSIYLLVGSVGVQPRPSLKISGDISYGADPLFSKDLRGLIRVEYRFGTAAKEGSR